MLKSKQIFPSRNYITIDCMGDITIVFNPVGDGFDGEDKLKFRKGRWAFRCNDFLSGKVLPNGKQEGMNRKVYNIAVVYDTEDGEPIIETTYVDPTSVIPLDGSVVQIAEAGLLATSNNQLAIIQAIQNKDLSVLATSANQIIIKDLINNRVSPYLYSMNLEQKKRYISVLEDIEPISDMEYGDIARCTVFARVEQTDIIFENAYLERKNSRFIFSLRGIKNLNGFSTSQSHYSDCCLIMNDLYPLDFSGNEKTVYGICKNSNGVLMDSTFDIDVQNIIIGNEYFNPRDFAINS